MMELAYFIVVYLAGFTTGMLFLGLVAFIHEAKVRELEEKNDERNEKNSQAE